MTSVRRACEIRSNTGKESQGETNWRFDCRSCRAVLGRSWSSSLVHTNNTCKHTHDQQPLCLIPDAIGTTTTCMSSHRSLVLSLCQKTQKVPVMLLGVEGREGRGADRRNGWRQGKENTVMSSHTEKETHPHERRGNRSGGVSQSVLAVDSLTHATNRQTHTRILEQANEWECEEQISGLEAQKVGPSVLPAISRSSSSVRACCLNRRLEEATTESEYPPPHEPQAPPTPAFKCQGKQRPTPRLHPRKTTENSLMCVSLSHSYYLPELLNRQFVRGGCEAIFHTHTQPNREEG